MVYDINKIHPKIHTIARHFGFAHLFILNFLFFLVAHLDANRRLHITHKNGFANKCCIIHYSFIGRGIEHYPHVHWSARIVAFLRLRHFYEFSLLFSLAFISMFSLSLISLTTGWIECLLIILLPYMLKMSTLFDCCCSVAPFIKLVHC